MSPLPLKKAKNVVVSERFRQVVALHILKNLLKKQEVRVPLLLGVHGPSGEGKTYQVEHVLREMGVKRFLISGGMLASPETGGAAELIRSTYIRASTEIRGSGYSLAAVLINDIDTGLGSWGESADFTLHQQTVFGELMHMVDYPNMVEGQETARVPIIITGNDFTRLYKPLVRSGRMTAFRWVPSLEERVEIVKEIFPELTREEVYQLVVGLADQLRTEMINPDQALPIAFYSHLRGTLLDEDLWREVEETSLERTVDIILLDKEPDFSMGINFERLMAKGLDLARSGQLLNWFAAPTDETQAVQS